MKDSKAMGSLADKLLCFVNTALVHDINYEIAVTMLKNYSRLHRMNLGELAELCYTSKSTLSRFCRFLGFESFKEMQELLTFDYSLSMEYSRSFQAMLNNNLEKAMESYRGQLIQNLESTLTGENLKIAENIVRKLRNSRNIAWFSHHFLWDIGHHFQSKMMMMGRYVEQFMDYGNQLKSAEKLGREDAAIICSIGGSYPTRYLNIWQKIISSGCRIVVITQNQSCPYWNNADYILPCGTNNQNDVGKYSALAATDLLIMSYLRRYEKEGGDHYGTV